MKRVGMLCFLVGGLWVGSSVGANAQSTGFVGRADLRISSLSVSVSTNLGPTGFVMRASVRVQNAGTRAAASSYLDVWNDSSATAACGDTGDASTSIGYLAPLASRTFSFTFTAPSGATGTYRVFADSQCTVTESNETNNQRTVTYTVP